MYGRASNLSNQMADISSEAGVCHDNVRSRLEFSAPQKDEINAHENHKVERNRSPHGIYETTAVDFPVCLRVSAQPAEPRVHDQEPNIPGLL